MAFTSIGDALQDFLKNAKWQSRIDEIRLKEKWEEIMGKTIAKYTRAIQLRNGILYIGTDVASLKQELQLGKAQIIKNINDYFKTEMIKSVVVR